MNPYRNIIQNFRIKNDESLLTNFKSIHNGKNGYGESYDKNYWNRKNLIFELYNDYCFEDKPLIKWLLREEWKGLNFGTPVYTNDLCAFMLYKHMVMEDVYDLYKAKFGAGDSDNHFFVDIELVFGQNKEETKMFLKNNKTNKKINKKILETIEWYESQEKAIYKDREEYIYVFETKKINGIKSNLAEIEQYQIQQGTE